jgi:hypothetical protein
LQAGSGWIVVTAEQPEPAPDADGRLRERDGGRRERGFRATRFADASFLRRVAPPPLDTIGDSARQAGERLDGRLASYSRHIFIMRHLWLRLALLAKESFN